MVGKPEIGRLLQCASPLGKSLFNRHRQTSPNGTSGQRGETPLVRSGGEQRARMIEGKPWSIKVVSDGADAARSGPPGAAAIHPNLRNCVAYLLPAVASMMLFWVISFSISSVV